MSELARVPVGSLTPDTRLVEDLGFDSLGLAELAASEWDDPGDGAGSFEDVEWEGLTLVDAFELMAAGAG